MTSPQRYVLIIKKGHHRSRIYALLCRRIICIAAGSRRDGEQLRRADRHEIRTILGRNASTVRYRSLCIGTEETDAAL
jgi:hypothetical protein